MYLFNLCAFTYLFILIHLIVMEIKVKRNSLKLYWICNLGGYYFTSLHRLLYFLIEAKGLVSML